MIPDGPLSGPGSRTPQLRPVLVPGYPPGPYCPDCGLTAWHWPGCPEENTP